MKNVILDFGHGGLDSNGNYTTAPAKMFKFPNGEIAYEGVINRQIGGLIEIFLRNHANLNVVTTVKYSDPRDLSLSHRVAVANKYSPNDSVFVSVHCNASLNHNVSGFSIYTTKGVTKSDEVATSIAQQVKQYYEKLNLPLRFDFYPDGDPDKEVDFYVLRKTRCPAVLLECLFFDFWDDFLLLKDAAFQKELAWHVYKGILSACQ
ncbi:N-acetylmuramoyl-L-alanine amidase [Geofilum sp. OHC36d9]|uniref:N-acetylmuramoyl-L-alanine amidase n=1 Tax=Geofilum sp. OHC36d9 TaxID=3458413 RepID=UPI004033B272